ncbi:MAG: hypothetical protein JWM27_2128 [Gemmatimonadetes bacterium]|nr:hypothetical protein [Gemmatimonadota bacterium]
MSPAAQMLEAPGSAVDAVLAGLADAELSDDDLEAVVGGLARTLEWTMPVVGG